MSPGPLLEGTRLIGMLAKSRGQEEIARQSKTTVNAVKHWVRGIRKPGSDARLLLLKAYAIPLEAWTTPVNPSVKMNGVNIEPGKNVAMRAPTFKIDHGMSAKELARQQLENLRERIWKAAQAGAGPRELASLENAYTNGVRLYSRLSGELEVTEATILRSPAWARITRLLSEVLERYPGAARAIAEAFENFGQEGG